MKRSPLLVLGGTVAGFVSVLGFHSRSPAVTLSGSGSGTSPGGTPAAAPSATPTATPSGTPSQGGLAGPSAGVRSAVGTSEQFGYGILDVKVTVSGTQITDVSVPSLQVAELTSQQISEQAIPLLRSEVLAAQSARIDAVSGATYTSEAYAASLQAAIDELHI